MSKHMSPQARRRLAACLHGQEWLDLAQEIVDALADMTERDDIQAVVRHVLEDGDA